MTNLIRQVEQQFQTLDSQIHSLQEELNAKNESPKGSIFERLEACKKRYSELTADLEDINKQEKEKAQFFIKSLQKAKELLEHEKSKSAESS